MVLLDEPFSALDAPVRDELRRELRRLQHDTGLSTVVVTHDPEEAALLADDILVISEGAVLQSGSVGEVFRRPASEQVARLLGIDNVRARSGGTPTASVRCGSVLIASGAPGLAPGSDLLWRVPAEELRIAPPAGASRGVPAATRPSSSISSTWARSPR